ncbi:histidine phosphatase family protein [Bifidobacterium sp. ESL0732]|uniref:histidine phosphatase family protein n=1 Tax=Bifidobacterium sp. ESL0732 TaxID=2983222 RepID=UPI0023F62A5C|nr:histidine phosphatase family protein [Bifidobacterium sp. ESL0732]WEV63849.1 histidine phosphatase family protein [Bifidobacterium sp. ESL0732]
MTSPTIYLARHTETTSNTMGLMQGWSDFPITQHGHEIIKCFGLGLKGITFNAAYSGSLPRHYQTARGALDYSGNGSVAVKQDPDLREDNFGSFEGRESKETNLAGLKRLGYSSMATALADRGTKINLDLQDAWHDLDAENALNTDLADQDRAESSADVRKRMNRAMRRIGEDAVKQHAGNILVVSSGLSIRQFLFLVNPDTDFTGLQNTAVTKLCYENGTFRIIGKVASMEYYERGKASLSE